MLTWCFLGWLAAVGVVGSVVSVYDKWAAKHNQNTVSAKKHSCGSVFAAARF